MDGYIRVTAGPVSRTWRVGSTVIILRHNTVLGDYLVSVDGVESPICAGRCTFVSGKAFIPLSPFSGMKGYIIISPVIMAGAFAYSCWVGDPATQAVEDNAVVSEATASAHTVAVNAYEVGRDEAGQPLVWFRIAAKRNADGATTTVHRRHREFFAMHETVLSAYQGSALASSFPPPPSRTLPFVNTSEPAFLEGRRAELHNQLVKLEALPRMGRNPDFAAFLGLVEGGREASVLFPPGAPLGISLHNSGAYTDVEKIAAEGLAEKSGVISVGAHVSRVNGEDVLGEPYDVILAKLKAAARPMVVHFVSEGSGSGPVATTSMAAFATDAPVMSEVTFT
jgi:hypothetical protein